MLQIITEKFYPPGERHETLHRTIFYTNLRCYGMAPTRIETQCGTLLPTTTHEGLSAFSCEIVEKIVKSPDGLKPGTMISTGGTSLLNDFAAVCAFGLNITCTPDIDLAKRLLAKERQSLGVEHVPSKVLRRIFDDQIVYKDDDGVAFSAFVDRLVGLKRDHYEATIKAIRQYITGLHRISDNASLAYTMLVMSMESLVQGFDGHIADWDDLDQQKRTIIDAALTDGTSEVAKRVREAVLTIEHVASARRFRDFVSNCVQKSYFREEAVGIPFPATRADLGAGLKAAYTLRSKYVHTLRDVPRELVMENMPEIMDRGGQPTLTFAGLARLARHTILHFIESGPQVATEAFDLSRAYPNIMTFKVAPEYWIGSPSGFNSKQGPVRLSAFIEHLLTLQPGMKNAAVIDLRPVLSLIEKMLPGLSKSSQRLPLLALYFLFHKKVTPEFHMESWERIFEAYKADFDAPTVESFVCHLLTGYVMDWSLPEVEALVATYFKTRGHAGKTKLSPILEAALVLYLAELHRVNGNEARAVDLIGGAVEHCPNNAALTKLEAATHTWPLSGIEPHALIFPELDRDPEAAPK